MMNSLAEGIEGKLYACLIIFITHAPSERIQVPVLCSSVLTSDEFPFLAPLKE